MNTRRESICALIHCFLNSKINQKKVLETTGNMKINNAYKTETHNTSKVQNMKNQQCRLTRSEKLQSLTCFRPY